MLITETPARRRRATGSYVILCSIDQFCACHLVALQVASTGRWLFEKSNQALSGMARPSLVIIFVDHVGRKKGVHCRVPRQLRSSSVSFCPSLDDPGSLFSSHSAQWRPSRIAPGASPSNSKPDFCSDATRLYLSDVARPPFQPVVAERTRLASNPDICRERSRLVSTEQCSSTT